ncbi:MAG TPA: SpoIIE family protein phosphatase [Solirubrobacteraceae bacterium]|nr:SpoIIE family protein phosphatase [Solirubrobacteraceae bacterium]
MTPRTADRAAAAIATAAGAAVLALFAVLDIVTGHQVVLVVAVMTGPVVAVLAAGPRQVAALAVAAVAVSLASGGWNDNLGDADWAIRAAVVAVGGASAVAAARSRARERGQMGRMQLLERLAEVADGSLSVGATAERIVDVLVPAFGDLAVIDVVRPGGLTRVAAAGAGAAAVRGARPPGLPAAAELLDGPAEVARALGSDAAGFAGGLVVPLQARGRTLGALVVAASRRLGARDLEFARVSAGRAALALDTAGLSSELSVVERQLAAALSNLAEAVTVQDVSGNIVFANQAAADLLGFERPEDVVATTGAVIVAHFDSTHADGRPIEVDELPGRRVLLGEEPPPLLVRARRRDTGEERWRVVKATAVRDGAGRVQFAVNVVEDVTDVKRAELAQRLLAEASSILASSLDLRETLERVAQVAVPSLADWCAVHVPGDSGALELVAVAHTDPEQVERAREIGRRFPARLDEPGGIARVLREGTADLMPVIPPEALAHLARSPEHLESLRGIDIRSAMTVPMRAAGRPTGVITFVNGSDRPPFGEAELEIALEIGRRAGVAAENARLFEERAEIAETLQRDLLPPDLPEMAGWRTATMYRAAGLGAEVGGDFYDAFPVGDGWLVVVGDVAGRGPAAASLTAMARYTLRTAATLTGDAGEAVRILNRALAERPRMALCSVCVVHLHGGARDGEVMVLAAGHPDPYIVRDGVATRLVVGGPLLGALPDGEWPPLELELEPREQIVVYTDGVIDAQGTEDRFGERRLAATLQGARGAADAVARVRDALDEFAGGGRRDDTAVLAIEREPAAAAARAPARHETRLPSGAAAPGAARRAVEAWLGGVYDEARLNDVRLLVSEVVTNGVVHGGEPLDLVVAVGQDVVRIEIHDQGPGFRPGEVTVPPPEATGGRGLMLVDRIAARWGVGPGPRHFVWFELDLG